MELFSAEERKIFEAQIRAIQLLDSFPVFENYVLEKLPTFIGSHFANWNEYDGMMNLTRVATSRSHAEKVAAVAGEIAEAVKSHPLFSKYIDPESGKACYVDTVDRLRSAIADSEYYELPFYIKVAKHLEIEDQLVMHLYIEDTRGIVVTFHASQMFDEINHFKASILRGHLVARLYAIDLAQGQREEISRNLDEHLRRRISPREISILRHVCNGLSNSEIADLLGISKRTADHHVSSILRKLCATNRFQLIARFGSWLVAE